MKKDNIVPFKSSGMKVVKTKNNKGVQLYSWSAISRCIAEDCPAFESCEFEKGNRCGVEAHYIKNVEAMIIENFGLQLKKPDMFRIGLHLVPLYKILCKLKIYEQSVDASDMMVEDNRGHRKMDPVFKEIRDTYKTINMVWKEIGIDKLEPLDNKNEPQVDMKKTPMTMGDRTFSYD